MRAFILNSQLILLEISKTTLPHHSFPLGLTLLGAVKNDVRKKLFFCPPPWPLHQFLFSDIEKSGKILGSPPFPASEN